MVYYESNYLCHYGLKGMKWGTRRWQFQDGRFNDAGKARYFGQNSSHRPDSVRALQGDPPKSNRSSATSDSSSSGNRSFDKERAKKIAKNVAIGAAIVGGTVLAVYGAKKIHDLGGVSSTAHHIASKYHDMKIENLKATHDYKEKMANIRSEGKQNLARIKGETKEKLRSIREEAKTNLEKISNEAKLERRMNKIDPDRKMDRNELRSHILERESKARAMWEKTGGGNGALLNRHMRESRKSIDNFYKRSISGDKTISSNAKAIRIKSPAQIVSEYKRAHPGTKLSNSQIVKNYTGVGAKGSGSVSSSRKTPKLTLTPETFQAGSQFLFEFNKTVQTFKSTNQDQARKAERGAKAVDDYTNELAAKGKKK